MAYIQKNSFVILFFALIFLLSLFTVISHNDDQAQMVQIKIEQGDSLWQLAEVYSGNMPKQEWIDQIMKENQMDGPVITAGQTLEIPEEHLKFVPDQNIKLASDAE